MKRTLLVLVCLAGMAFAWGVENPTRLDVTTVPVGAVVRVDGTLRGPAPVSVFSLAPGAHHVQAMAPGYQTADEIVQLAQGEYAQKSLALEVEKALMLIKTEPAGAEVRLDGAALGTTPLVLTTLNAGRTYAFDLVLTGYRTKRIDVTPEGRIPIARDETLMLDSGVVECSTEPSGAEVSVNGVVRGTSPLTLDRIPKGRAVVKVVKAGYRTETRELSIAPGDQQHLALTLKPLAASLTVVSQPEGARVFLDTNYQGKTPVTFAAEPGEHDLRVELVGCAPATRKVTLENGASATEEFKMENVLGRLEIITTPPGARVFVEGKSVGFTQSKPGSARSASLAVEKVEAGVRTVTARLDGYAETTRKVLVKSKETATVHMSLKRLFVPDTEVETVQGSVRRGVLLANEFDGLHLETAPGVEQIIPKADVRRVTPLKK